MHKWLRIVAFVLSILLGLGSITHDYPTKHQHDQHEKHRDEPKREFVPIDDEQWLLEEQHYEEFIEEPPNFDLDYSDWSCLA